MAGGYKRKLEDFDPNKSDSEDLDYGAASPPRPQGKRRRNRSKPRKGAKRARRDQYGSSDDEISLGSEEESEESFAESEEQEEPERNPRTGRAVRGAVKKAHNYQEPSDEDEDDSGSDDELKPSPQKKARRTVERESLVVKLKLPTSAPGSATRSKVGGKALKREPTPSMSRPGTRRSSRISRDEEAPLVALTDSGKHEVVTRAGTATPDPESGRRPTRASKGLKKPPSAIMEASQEYSQSQQGNYEPVFDEDDPMEPHPGMDTSARGDTQRDDEDEEDAPIEAQVDESDDDDGPVRSSRTFRKRKASSPPVSQSTRNLRQRKTGPEPSSDFEPDAEGEADEEDLSESDGMLKPSRGGSTDSPGGRRRLGKTRSQRSRSARHETDEEDDLDQDEIADEAADLAEDNRRNRRSRRRDHYASASQDVNLRARSHRPDYRIFRPENLAAFEEEDAPATATPTKGRKGAAAPYRSLFQTAGPFGGFGGPPPVFGGQDGQGAAGGVDSDSSDDELGIRQPQNAGGNFAQTPTSAFPKPFVPQAVGPDPVQAPGGGPPGLGKVKDRKALADADPLGVDPNVGFESVGGLDDHIDRLKEMVALPLLYPEIFQRFKVTPPRGVLFHGPPGTGKTLLARALAASVSSNGRKVTFYMRKGADALSKWVGEAEKQLRLLFEEARKNQPSIIFFDEIDGLAPVRSSKQEQIHASIVATLLALMDGMDGRGQVIVIGATNRPDSVDPALRRPGRFDREFYFPLPSLPARRSIIDIHTKGWDPPLAPAFKDQLAEMTKGYGGADLRALCTEAALNAVQGTYPQIYSSDQKLVIDPSTIKVLAKDFMISVNKIVPSSERSAASGAAPLKSELEPLLRPTLDSIIKLVESSIPRKKPATALEEAMYDDRDDEFGFEKENVARQFEASRVFRPRLLVKGPIGMGQQYLGAALLARLEGVHVQNMGLSVLLSDSTRSPEAAIIQLFEEVKRHKPSVIFIPQVDVWYRTLPESVVKTFVGLLRGLQPTDPVLLLGLVEYERSEREIESKMLRDLFGYSLKTHFELTLPDRNARVAFFQQIVKLVRRTPLEFPDPEGRKRREIEPLPIAAAEPMLAIEPSKADVKAQKKRDRQTLNVLKINIQQVMDQIKLKYKKFRAPIIEDSAISYLYDEESPQVLLNDIPEEQRQVQAEFRPYEIDKDEKGVQGLRDVRSNKFYYNLEIVTIEKRLSNGYYKRPKDFLSDIKRLAKDAKTIGDQDRILKANEMLANVEVDMTTLETQQPALIAECEAVYQREQVREHERLLKQNAAMREGQDVPFVVPNLPPQIQSKSTTENTGPVVLGEELSGRKIMAPQPPAGLIGPTPGLNQWSSSNGVRPSTNGSGIPVTQPGESPDMYSASQVPNPQGAIVPYGTPIPLSKSQQRALHTSMEQHSAMNVYDNSASTTSSGLKGANKSDPSKSDPSKDSNGKDSNDSKNSKLSKGTHGSALSGPDFFSYRLGSGGGSDLPDTQSSQSQPLGDSPSLAMAPPQRPMPVSSLLNVSTMPPNVSAAPNAMAPPPATAPPAIANPQSMPAPPLPLSAATQAAPVQAATQTAVAATGKELTTMDPPAPPSRPKSDKSTKTTDSARLIMDEAFMSNLLSALVHRSSGCSIEQLEQIHAHLMGAIWQYKTEWNRVKVATQVQVAFNEIIGDIEACQKVLNASQDASQEANSQEHEPADPERETGRERGDAVPKQVQTQQQREQREQQQRPPAATA